MAGRPLRRARLEAEARANGETLPVRRDHRAEMTEKLIAQLQSGTAPWQKTWTVGSGGRPYNPLSADPHTASGQRGYSGINRIVLMVEGAAYGDDRWCTRKQAEERGYTLRPGMSGTTIEVWKLYVPKAAGKDDEDRNKADDRSRMGVRFYTVFNAAQFSDFPPVERVEHAWTPIERAEQLLAGSGAKIIHSASEETPHYAPGRDHIVLPSRERFVSPEAYYDTATHELVHWTGHESRLNRFEPDAHFGTPSYAREELVAEIGSMFLSADTVIAHNTAQHAAYVASWIKLLQDDKNAVARAAGAASKAVDHVLSLEREKSATKTLVAEQQYTTEVVAARGLPASMTSILKSNDERCKYDPLDGAFVAYTSGRHVETFGNEHPVLAVRGANNGGCSLRFDERDAAWRALTDAVAGKGRVESRMAGYVRDANEVERHAQLSVVVGRTTTGRILISMYPLLEPDKTVQVRLTREAAALLARAMETNNHRQRKALVFEALHHDMEMTYEHTR
jgi:antirestriction protein ArdC